MTATAQAVLDQALQLPEDDRDWIADSLLRSLHAEQFVENDEEWERLWAAEIERRCKEVDEGKVKLIPHEEVMARLRAKLQR